jgi:hypothetical protein
MYAGLTVAALLAVAAPATADDSAAGSWRRYDAQGRYAGNAYRASAGQLRFYDAKGRFAGTARQRPDGAWRTYDRNGRFSGTVRSGKPK